jgi:type II secretory pathway pseudopilin PulG
VELMVAMVVVGIFLGGVFVTFTNFLSNSGEQAALSRRGFDTRLGLDLMRSDLREIGYGIAATDLPNTVQGTPITITFFSTAVHSRGDAAGLQGVVFESGGNKFVNDGFGGTVAANQSGAVITPDRTLISTVNAGNITARQGNLFFAGPASTAAGYYYRRQYYLGGGTSPGCAPNTPNLLFRDGVGAAPAGPGTSIVDCVLDLQFRYGFEVNGGGVAFSNDPSSPPAGNTDAFPDVIKVGMVVQVGSQYRGQQPSPQNLAYADADLATANPVGLTQAQQQFRWQVVEWSVPLEDMP